MMYANDGGRLADEHRRELLREAQRDQLAARVSSDRDGMVDRALLLLAAALALAAERARIHYARRRLARRHAGMTGAGHACPAGLRPACASFGRS